MIRKLVAGAVCAALFASGAAVAQQTFPNKPIRMVVPYAAGGGSDILARLLGDNFQKSMGQPVIVENKAGANTAIAADFTAKSAPDGYTIMIVATAFSTVPAGNPKAFDPINDFTPIGRVSNILLVLVANPKLPFRTVAEMIAYAKANPGKLTMATSSIGGSDHLAVELLNLRAGINTRVIPYKGAAPAINDLLGGQVDLRFDAMPSSRPHLDSGKLKAIAVAELVRSSMAPDIPTFAESGLPGFDVPGYYGFVGPKGLPRDIVARYNRELTAAVRIPEIRDRMRTLGLDPVTSTPEEFGKLVKDGVDMWGKVIRDAGIKID